MHTSSGDTSETPAGEGLHFDNHKARSSKNGLSVLTRTIKTLSSSPGVYRMVGVNGEVLYVGKAKNLKKRVSSYLRLERIPMRLQRMVFNTHSCEIITTHTEAEALLLESNLIKQLKPRYNILLRDDKSFPYILIEIEHEFPRIVKHRGARKKGIEHFGPFASARAVNSTLTALQKVFLLRTCTDSVFANRTRPCLLYQIKRCAAPCVGYVNKETYGDYLRQAREFLRGDSHALQTELAKLMDTASARLDYEAAASFRDRIRAMTAIQAHQGINFDGIGEADVVAIYRIGNRSCIQVFFFRNGQNFGNRAYYPAHAADDTDGEIIEAFIGQFYASYPPPKEILLNTTPPHREVLEAALALRAKRKIKISMPKRGGRRKLIDHTAINAREALERRLAENTAQRELLEGTAKVLELNTTPERIEVYDNSHTSGAHMVGAMIVTGPSGLIKTAYRKFNIKSANLAPGDDYGAMREVLTRRFSRAQKEDPDRSRGQWPDLVLLDGGQGQLNAGLSVFEDLGIDDIALAAIAKGPNRNAGREQLFLPDKTPFTLPSNHPVLYFLQRLRDEAHRYAITAHRSKRSKTIGQSLLDEIAGIGTVRKKSLLRHFGSSKAVSVAGLADMKAAPGINAITAKNIYDHFHPEG